MEGGALVIRTMLGPSALYVAPLRPAFLLQTVGTSGLSQSLFKRNDAGRRNIRQGVGQAWRSGITQQ